ncbi:carbohydrate kinase family protein [Christiangramia salexigens]|uniref:Carbohydrate kinase n=1 Tax=Christiangramia salexigens TaxID=1913577 RepID=A0A1L3J6E3_9FLAO|nr:carbohydrate kinase [Christiangramia salexigens]APG60670.1 carbohydrate kinase [Christiangramia salexigens]
MSKNVVCFGEVLWDVLPTGEKIGGAPLNVALRLNSLNVDSTIISKVGNDQYGERLIEYLSENGQNHIIQRDKEHETGVVDVKIDQAGNASYTIKFPAAWDHIDYTQTLKKKVSNADYFIYGSLVNRNDASRGTLFKLLEVANYKVLDVNLRKTHYNLDTLIDLMSFADFIKLNREELEEVCNYLEEGKASSVTEMLKLVSDHTQIDHICVTQGACGVTLFHKGEFYHNSGFLVKVKDTVGAGDSFLAGYIAQLIEGKRPNMALDFACALAGLVASKSGANSAIAEEEINTLLWVDSFKHK